MFSYAVCSKLDHRELEHQLCSLRLLLMLLVARETHNMGMKMQRDRGIVEPSTKAGLMH